MDPGDWAARLQHKGCQGWNRAQCVSKHVCETARGIVRVCVGGCVGGGGQIVSGADLLRAGLNEVIARPLSICYRGSSSDQGVAMARWTQKGVAWERVQGS